MIKSARTAEHCDGVVSSGMYFGEMSTFDPTKVRPDV
jgi:hypothetical protein